MRLDHYGHFGALGHHSYTDRHGAQGIGQQHTASMILIFRELFRRYRIL